MLGNRLDQGTTRQNRQKTTASYLDGAVGKKRRCHFHNWQSLENKIKQHVHISRVARNGNKRCVPST